MNEPPLSSPPPSQKEHFDLLLSALNADRLRFVESGFKVAATLLIVLGWFITTETPTLVIRKLPTLLWHLLLPVALLAPVMAFCTFRSATRHLQRQHGLLLEVSYFQPKYLAHLKPHKLTHMSITWMNTIFMLLIVMAILIARYYRVA